MCGLTSQQYYAVSKLSNVNAVAECKKYLPLNIWKKFDRGRPLTDRQAENVSYALNQTVLEMSPDYPLTTLIVMMGRSPATKGHIYYVNKVCMIRLLKKTTEHGSVYVVPQKQIIEHNGITGEVGFTKHAIDRFLDRVPELRKFIKQDTGIVLQILWRASRDGIVQVGSKGPQLKVGSIGYFPIVYAKEGFWVCTTFLNMKMKGTAKQEQIDIRDGIKELVRKYD